MITNNSVQTIYRYPLPTRLFTVVFNISAFIMPIYFTGKVILRSITENISLSPTALLAIIAYSLFLGLVLAITANFFSEIIADNDGLSVHFLWYRLHLQWHDIVEIKPSFFNLPNRPATWVVHTRKLTLFHRLYGLLYSFTPIPSFIIRYEIENREKLIQMIENKRYE